jgi:hypothetical protein
MTTRSLQRHMAALVNMGFLERIYRRGRSAVTRIRLDVLGAGRPTPDTTVYKPPTVVSPTPDSSVTHNLSLESEYQITAQPASPALAVLAENPAGAAIVFESVKAGIPDTVPLASPPVIEPVPEPAIAPAVAPADVPVDVPGTTAQAPADAQADAQADAPALPEPAPAVSPDVDLVPAMPTAPVVDDPLADCQPDAAVQVVDVLALRMKPIFEARALANMVARKGDQAGASSPNSDELTPDIFTSESSPTTQPEPAKLAIRTDEAVAALADLGKVTAVPAPAVTVPVELVPAAPAPTTKPNDHPFAEVPPKLLADYANTREAKDKSRIVSGTEAAVFASEAAKAGLTIITMIRLCIWRGWGRFEARFATPSVMAAWAAVDPEQAPATPVRRVHAQEVVPPASPEIVEAERSKIAALREKINRQALGNKTWATTALAKAAAGDHVAPATLTAARNALRL